MTNMSALPDIFIGESLTPGQEYATFYHEYDNEEECALAGMGAELGIAGAEFVDEHWSEFNDLTVTA